MSEDKKSWKLWGGRMTKPTDMLVHRLNASLPFDIRLFREDIEVNRAWAHGLGTAGLLTKEELEKITAGLDQILGEFQEDTFQPSPSDEDIHSVIERRLTELIGPIAGKLHTGRSRNDQVATDFRLWVMRACDHLHDHVRNLCLALLENAEGALEIPMPGYTHLQHAQPVTWGHWILSHLWPLLRDRDRIAQARASAAVLPLGSGALAGTPFPIDRHALASDLGFTTISPNSIDAVADRDFALEFLFAGATLGVHLSRFAETLILFNSAEFGFIQLNDAYTTGSSLMPQKKNPDPLELARGKSGRLIGSLTGLLSTLKGLPSAYDKDLQEDKEPVFDAFDTLNSLLPVLTDLIRTLQLRPQRMASHLEIGLLATDLADDLVRKGVPFREAHHLVGQAVQLAEEQGITLKDLSMEDLKKISQHFTVDFQKVFDFQVSLSRKAVPGGTAPQALQQQVNAARRMLS